MMDRQKIHTPKYQVGGWHVLACCIRKNNLGRCVRSSRKSLPRVVKVKVKVWSVPEFGEGMLGSGSWAEEWGDRLNRMFTSSWSWFYQPDPCCSYHFKSLANFSRKADQLQERLNTLLKALEEGESHTKLGSLLNSTILQSHHAPDKSVQNVQVPTNAAQLHGTC